MEDPEQKKKIEELAEKLKENNLVATKEEAVRLAENIVTTQMPQSSGFQMDPNKTVHDVHVDTLRQEQKEVTQETTEEESTEPEQVSEQPTEEQTSEQTETQEPVEEPQESETSEETEEEATEQTETEPEETEEDKKNSEE